MFDSISLLGITGAAILKYVRNDAGPAIAGGILGNRVDALGCELWKSCWKRIKENRTIEELSLNVSLLTAISSAQLDATEFLGDAVINRMKLLYKETRDPFLHENYVSLKKDLSGWIDVQKSALKKSISIDSNSPAYQRIELLLASSMQDSAAAVSAKFRLESKRMMVERVEGDLQKQLPGMFKDMLFDGWEEEDVHLDWYDIMTRNFDKKLGDPANMKLKSSFESRLLSEISVNTRMILSDTNVIRKGMDDMAGTISEMKDLLTQLILNQAGRQQDDFMDNIDWAIASERMKKARSLFEMGRFKEAAEALDYRGRDAEMEKKLKEKERHQEEWSALADEEAMLAISSLKNKEDPLRLEHAQSHFERSVKLCEKYEHYQNYATYLKVELKFDEAIALYNKALMLLDDKCRSSRASVYLSMGLCYTFSNRPLEGKNFIEQALQIYGELSENVPGAHVADMASCLSLLAITTFMIDGKNANETIRLYTEALSIYEKLADEDPDKYASLMIDTLRNLSNFIKISEDRELAQFCYHKAKVFSRWLFLCKVDAFQHHLDGVFHNVGDMLNESAEHENELIEIYLRVIEARRRLVQADFDQYWAFLASSLDEFRKVLEKGLRLKEAAACYEEIISIFRQKAEKEPENFSKSLIGLTHSLGDLYRRIPDYPKSAACYVEMADFFWRELPEHPEYHYICVLLHISAGELLLECNEKQEAYKYLTRAGELLHGHRNNENLEEAKVSLEKLYQRYR